MSDPLFRAADVRELEARLAAGCDLPPSLLMQRAGAALLNQVRCHWPEARRVLVLVGTGNNGGDGYVLARLLRERGVQAWVLAMGPARAPEAIDAAGHWQQSGGVTQWWDSALPLPSADLIVDALFGIGLTRAPDAGVAALIEAVNAADAPVLSVDLPSGLDADSGHAPGPVVRAARTLCLLARKRGLYTGRARDEIGTLAFDDLRTPRDAVDAEVRLLDRDDLRTRLPRRRPGTHKGEQGHALVIGGDTGMSGAVRLAGLAALRAGAGWVSAASHSDHVALIAAGRPELMVHGVEDAGALAPLLQRADVLALGPGLGQGDWSQAMFEASLASDRLAVMDADALNLLARKPHELGRHRVITPHPGEAARLLAVDTAAIEADRFAAVRELARRYACVAVLKGAGTLIDDGERTWVCPFGNPGMASAGMGDALTGIIAALLGQGVAPVDAACAGVLAHALAGDRAAGSTPRGLIASDVIDQLRAVLTP